MIVTDGDNFFPYGQVRIDRVAYFTFLPTSPVAIPATVTIIRVTVHKQSCSVKSLLHKHLTSLYLAARNSDLWYSWLQVRRDLRRLTTVLYACVVGHFTRHQEGTNIGSECYEAELGEIPVHHPQPMHGTTLLVPEICNCHCVSARTC